MRSWVPPPGLHKPGTVAHTWNPRELEAEGSRVQGQSQESQDQPRVHEVIPQNNSNNREKKMSGHPKSHLQTLSGKAMNFQTGTSDMPPIIFTH